MPFVGTQYTGDPTATQAPSGPPTIGASPIVLLPVDTDDFSAAAFWQQFKVFADWIAYAFAHGAFQNGANEFAQAQTFDAGIYAGAGVNLAFHADVGKKFTFNRDVQVSGRVDTSSDVAITGVGVFTRNDSTLNYGSGAAIEAEFYGSSKLLGQLIQASATTTDAATVVAAITYPISNGFVYQIVTTVTATKSDFSEALMAMTADTFRRTGGVTTNVASKTLYTATDEIGVTAYGWNLSGADLVYQIQGRAATTIRWNIKAEFSIIG